MAMVSSHRLPVNPSIHSQWKVPSRFLHWPLFRQGLGALLHSSMSVSQLAPVYWSGQRHR